MAVSKLPHHRAEKTLNRSQVYLVFQTNEGDTPKNAYSFREGNWLSEKRGSVPIAWGVDSLIGKYVAEGRGAMCAMCAMCNNAPLHWLCADANVSTLRLAPSDIPTLIALCWSRSRECRYFPGLWEYYVHSALESDSFFGATGGVGYTYPWSLPDHDAFFRGSAELFEAFMPTPDNFVDLWEGACPSGVRGSRSGKGGRHALGGGGSESGDVGAAGGSKLGGENPCMPMYQRYRDLSNKTVAGFSQQPTLPAQAADPTLLVNKWLPDGTAVLSPPPCLWYPGQKKFCNASLPVDQYAACIAQWVTKTLAANTQRPLFLLSYGVDHYVDVAVAMQSAFADSIQVIGAQDLAALSRMAAPTPTIRPL